VAAGTLPLGGDIAAKWAKEYSYPLSDGWDLARVAQFIAVHDDPMAPKELLCVELKKYPLPDFSRTDEPHAALAELPLSLFITTNYDDLMFEALRADPRREICRWNRSLALADVPRVLDPGFVPTPATPVVFHLHGHFDVPDSLVLTEDDYLDFLVAVSRDDALLPHQIQKALAGASLLFVGYRLADWDFRVLHRGLVMAGEQSLRRLSINVQLPPNDDPSRDYLERYFGAMHVDVYWGNASEFATELRKRLGAPAGA
jgi:SIR2-like domain